MEISRQILHAPIMLLQEAREIGALGEGQPDALDLHVGDDRTSVRGLADAEGRLEARRIGRCGRVDDFAVDDHVVRRALHGAGDANGLAFVFAQPQFIDRDRVFAERIDKRLDFLFRGAVRIGTQREHADPPCIGQGQHEVAELRPALLVAERRAVENRVALFDIFLDEGFGRIGRRGRARLGGTQQRHCRDECGQQDGVPGRGRDLRSRPSSCDERATAHVHSPLRCPIG